jgi:hypothetical protein
VTWSTILTVHLGDDARPGFELDSQDGALAAHVLEQRTACTASASLACLTRREGCRITARARCGRAGPGHRRTGIASAASSGALESPSRPLRRGQALRLSPMNPGLFCQLPSPGTHRTGPPQVRIALE